MSAFPGGTYVTLIRFFDSRDENIISLKYAQDMISRDRVNF